jgi:hypothetical protein
MPRREKTTVASKRRPHIVPMEASTDPRAMAKHPIEHRGGSAPRQTKRGGKRSAR